MIITTITIQDLRLAWFRLKQDRMDGGPDWRKRSFVNHPYLISLIEDDLDVWLSNILTKLHSGYHPNSSVLCQVPKASWMIRNAEIITLEDEVVFNAVLAKLHQDIWKRIGLFQGDPDIAYQLQPPSEDQQWIKSGLVVWEEFREKSLLELQKGAQYVLFADITAFYDNIDLRQLRSDLNDLEAENSLVQTLMDFLTKWDFPRGRGIPQGYSSSDILAKIYMFTIDQTLLHEGFRHLRYVDDIRIFCKNESEAKKALLVLNKILHEKNLSLQSAKTIIYSTEDARREILSVVSLIQGFQKQMKKELSMDPYVSSHEVEVLIKQSPDKLPADFFEGIFREYLLDKKVKFNKTIFRYVIHRLADTKSNIAIDYCLDVLVEHPEETEDVLRYLSAIAVRDEQLGKLLAYMKSQDALYDYQLYQIVSWFFERKTCPPTLLSLCLDWARNKNKAPWLRTYSIALLGLFGARAELDMIRGLYSVASTDIEKAEIVIALKRLETSQRNAFYNQVIADGELIKRAVVKTKGTSN